MRVTVFVAVSPHEAFETFTADVDLWWRRGPRFRAFPGDSTLVFEERTRLVERSVEGAEHVVGAVRAWEPGVRLAFEWRAVNFAADEHTEVEVTFEAKGRGTEVVLLHRGWANVRADHPVRHGQDVPAFLGTLGRYWGGLLTALRERPRG